MLSSFCASRHNLLLQVVCFWNAVLGNGLFTDASITITRRQLLDVNA